MSLNDVETIEATHWGTTIRRLQRDGYNITNYGGTNGEVRMIARYGRRIICDITNTFSECVEECVESCLADQEWFHRPR